MATTNRTRLAGDYLPQFPNAGYRVAGFTLLAVGTLWLSLLAAGDGAFQVDVSITRFIQDYTSTVTTAITDFGNAFGTATVGVPLGIAFALLLVWRGHPRGGMLLAAATFLRISNYGLKAFFDSPRPTPDLVQVHSTRSTNGFPSGHAQSATLLCGALLIALWPVLNRGQRIVATVIAGGAVLATSYARISVGAHWPTDVVGGVLWGTILLSLMTLAIRRATVTRAFTRRLSAG